MYARAREVEGKFIVLKDSRARVNETPTLHPTTKRRRKKLIEDKALEKTEDGRHYIFKRDVPFDSTSAAAGVVSGAQIASLDAWKHKKTRVSYREWRNKRLDDAQKSKDTK